MTKGDWIDHAQKPKLTLNKVKESSIHREFEKYLFG